MFRLEEQRQLFEEQRERDRQAFERRLEDDRKEFDERLSKDAQRTQYEMRTLAQWQVVIGVIAILLTALVARLCQPTITNNVIVPPAASTVSPQVITPLPTVLPSVEPTSTE